MEQRKIEKIERFINYGNKLPNDTIGLSLVVQIVVSFFITITSHNYKTSIFYVVPSVVLALIFYVVFKFIKKPMTKHLNLFFGIECMIISLTFACGCFLVTPLTGETKIKLLLVLVLINAAIIGLMILISVIMVSAKELPLLEKVSKAAVAPFALLGVILSRLFGTSQSFWIFAFSLASFICSVFVIYIVKYYYARVLENSVR